jgi:hypothetical protein
MLLCFFATLNVHLMANAILFCLLACLNTCYAASLLAYPSTLQCMGEFPWHVVLFCLFVRLRGNQIANDKHTNKTGCTPFQPSIIRSKQKSKQASTHSAIASGHNFIVLFKQPTKHPILTSKQTL